MGVPFLRALLLTHVGGRLSPGLVLNWPSQNPNPKAKIMHPRPSYPQLPCFPFFPNMEKGRP